MANIKSAKKRVITNNKKADKNKALRSDLKTALKKAEFALENKAADTATVVGDAIKKIDRASTRGILHSNNAAHKKSSLVKKLSKV